MGINKRRQELIELIASTGVMGVGIAVILSALLTGCISTVASPLDDSRFLMAADERGMRAFGDMMVGVANEARTPDGVKGSHYQLREKQEAERTQREVAPGFLSKLFSKGG